MKKVYLAGPITGASWNQSEDWRDELKALAEESVVYHTTGLRMGPFADVKFYSPLRGKDYLRNESEIGDSYSQFKFSTPHAIMIRDHHDVQTCDVVIANLTGATRVSIGTVMEIAWAYAYRKPVICIMEPAEKQVTGFEPSVGKNIHEHSMLNEAIYYRAESVEEALMALNHILNP